MPKHKKPSKSSKSNRNAFRLLDVTKQIHALMMPRLQKDSIFRTSSSISPVEEAMRVAKAMIPSAVEVSSEIFRNGSERGLIICDQRSDIKMFYVSQSDSKELLKRAPAVIKQLVSDLLLVYEPDEQAVILMLTNGAVQPVWAYHDGTVRAQDATPLDRPLFDAPSGFDVKELDDTINQIEELHSKIHEDDPMPETDLEKQSALAITRIRSRIMSLVRQGIVTTILEPALFYHWLRLTGITRGFSDAKVERLAKRMDQLIGQVVSLLREIEATIKDDGPTKEMRALGEKLEEARDSLGAAHNEILPKAEAERQGDLVLRELMDVVGELLFEQVQPALIESVLLYFWLRSSTINYQVEEEFFQKLERHWPEVMERVEYLVRQW